MHIKWQNPTLNKQLKHADLLNSLILIFFFMYIHLFSTGLSYIYFFITFCVIIIVIFFIFFNTNFLSVLFAQVLFHVSRVLKLYFNFFELLNRITF